MSGDGPTVHQRDAHFHSRLRALADARVLTDHEELAAAALAADGRAAENALARLGGLPVTDLDQAAGLRGRVTQGEDARATLIASTGRLVASLVRHHDPDGLRRGALLLAAEEAVSRAVDRYDPSGGLPFSAFARWWVERAMRQVERHPVASFGGPDGTGGSGGPGVDADDPTLLTALGHLNRDDCAVLELRLGLTGEGPRSPEETADVLEITDHEEHEREEKALAKLRHPCTPGDLTHLQRL